MCSKAASHGTGLLMQVKPGIRIGLASPFGVKPGVMGLVEYSAQLPAPAWASTQAKRRAYK